MDHFPLNLGKPHHELADRRNIFQVDINPRNESSTDPITRTQKPIVTGTSVIALKYQDGVMLAADNLASYGSLARYKDVERLYPVGDFTVIGASGDYSDFQYTKHLLDAEMVKEYYTNDGHVLGSPHIYEYLSRVMYHRRSQINPLWNAYVVGGYHNGEGFLGYVDLLGTTYKSPSIATGFGAYLAQPILRKLVEGHEDTLSEEEAIDAIETCMRVLFYRDARSLNKFQRAKVTAKGGSTRQINLSGMKMTAVRRFVIKDPLLDSLMEKASLSCTDPIGGGKLSSLPPNVPCSTQLAVDFVMYRPNRRWQTGNVNFAQIYSCTDPIGGEKICYQGSFVGFPDGKGQFVMYRPNRRWQTEFTTSKCSMFGPIGGGRLAFLCSLPLFYVHFLFSIFTSSFLYSLPLFYVHFLQMFHVRPNWRWTFDFSISLPPTQTIVDTYQDRFKILANSNVRR
ncbi:20654_t:CDS:2 [Dentiscutata erythropus]|uniref:20654_t:CDS:1 n=1 Tax=Dentiscutata erythropus TaxID=1348616 RepID=A0A9N8Z252_9GLOM|nr:20654_t:CDS:2 [Dentiscutata erythropus]